MLVDGSRSADMNLKFGWILQCCDEHKIFFSFLSSSQTMKLLVSTLLALACIATPISASTFGGAANMGSLGYRVTPPSPDIRRRGGYSSSSRRSQSYMPFDTEDDLDCRAVQQCSVSLPLLESECYDVKSKISKGCCSYPAAGQQESEKQPTTHPAPVDFFRPATHLERTWSVERSFVLHLTCLVVRLSNPSSAE